MERTGITRQLLQSLVTSRLIEPAKITDTGRYLYDARTVKMVNSYLNLRKLKYPQAEIRRMFEHRFRKETDGTDSRQ